MPLNSRTHNTSSKPGALFVVATPIGNREDITLRALKILGDVDVVAAEDTRHTGRFLAYHNIKTKLISYHDHNEAERTPGLIKQLCAGASIALVSNAGTPSVSDPGYHLIHSAINSDIPIVPVPGVSAAITALSVAGLPTDAFVFVGFPAKKKQKRLTQLKRMANEEKTIVFYESPRRILTLLDEMISIMGDRYGVLSREMTKLHEEFIRGSLSEILHALKERPSVKGECTLLVAGFQEKAASVETIRKELKKELETPGSRLSDIAKEIAKKHGLSKKIVYDEALKIKRKAP
ncbi:MAG: 16S rRNA (cytidine(1402)-2'-O)-methyltransferase [Deltaproteobacteria bacterium]|nr:16S rRNA (cytidine(1402)-2'-O)-methyltransferase [Deltaproteobacteria bacterium]